MALTAGVVPRDAPGRVVTAVGVFTHFNGGTPITLTNELAVGPAPAAYWLGGMPYTASGALCVGVGLPVESIPGGWNITATGALCVDPAGVIAGYNAGLPVNNQGSLVTN